jgi:hypothetical protein
MSRDKEPKFIIKKERESVACFTVEGIRGRTLKNRGKKTTKVFLPRSRNRLRLVLKSWQWI